MSQVNRCVRFIQYSRRISVKDNGVMQVRINGKPEEIHEETVLHLLKSKNLEPQMVTVEVNSKIVPREELPRARLKEGDEIEFLFFMGGGAIPPVTPLETIVR